MLRNMFYVCLQNVNTLYTQCLMYDTFVFRKQTRKNLFQHLEYLVKLVIDNIFIDGLGFDMGVQK